MGQLAVTYYPSRLVHHIRTNGWRQGAVLVGKNMIWPVCDGVIRRRVRWHERFDEKYQIDTQTPVAVRDLERSAPAARFAMAYEGTPIPVVHKIIRRLEIDHRRFTFVDLGSGKGRVLLIAGQYPFKSVIGVEFSNRLHRIAEVNIAHFARHHLMKTMPRSVNMDASKFDLWPSGDRVVFCANPFAPQLMKTILDKLKASALESRIQTILIYLTPMPNETANCLGAFPLIGRGRWLSDLGGFQKYLIYRIG